MQVREWCDKYYPHVDFQCPPLTAYPNEAISMLETLIENSSDKVALIGSSLGGYFSTYLAEKYNLKAVLINPAVKPYELMKKYVDVKLSNYHTDQQYQLKEEHVEQYRALDIEQLQYLENYWLMVQTEDETLDYKAAVQKYKGCRQLVEEGGDHSFQDFDRWLPEIFKFLSIT